MSSEFSEGKSTTSRDRAASIANSEVSGELSRPSITSALAPNPRRSNDLSDFTIDKLKYASLGLHGRDQEVKLMKDALKNMMIGESPEQERQLILISGYSGTGKTALTNHALKDSTEKLGGVYVRGKFDLHLRNQPYSGISAACAEICGAIVALQSSQPSQFEQLCSQITTELGSELELLIQVIPVLAQVVDYEDAKADSSPIVMSSSADSKSQINFAFLRFIRAISYQFNPLVFVLDDLQWADGASLDLLEALLSDATGTSKLLVVGIYRSNEVDETHIFNHTMKELKAKSREEYFELTQLEIGNLGLDAVHTIIQELLGMDDSDSSRTWSLAEVCHRKTLGNVFFLLQFTAMLKERQMLQFNFGIVSWTWDEKEIEASTKASDNVVDLLKAKMAELPEDWIELLTLASCLGSTFEVSTLHLVWEKSNNARSVPTNRDTLMEYLERLEAEGYIVNSESKSNQRQICCWSHDKVQEAALSMVPEDRKGTFAAQVGQVLLSYLEEELDSVIFMVVNLLNSNIDGQMEGDLDAQLDLARLNCRASEKAVLCSAFDSAAEYAAKGIQLLPQDAWVDHYELALNLHNVGAKAESVMGNTETMELYCKQVTSQVGRPLEDKLAVYQVWIDNLLHSGLWEEAKDLAFEILGKFKCHFPKNPALVAFATIIGVIRLKANLKSTDASKLKVLSDPTRIELLNVIDKLGNALFQTKDSRLPLCTFKALRWAKKYGYCQYSSVTFCGAGLVLTGILHDIQGGSKYAEQALIVLDGSKSQVAAARTMFLVYGAIFAFTKPIRSLLKPVLQGYDIGLQTG
jgi:predicted ATPase